MFTEHAPCKLIIHIVCYIALGYYVPNQYVIILVVSILCEFLEYFIFSMTYKLRNKKNYTEDIKMFPSFGPELLLKQSWEYFKIL